MAYTKLNTRGASEEAPLMHMDDSELNESPSLTKGKSFPGSRNRKRLIVLCDGTWQDSTAGSDEYPSNVTRFARALSKYGFDEKGQELEQIVYYQKGVGTGLTDKLTGGAFGYGVSANVRSAYAFLAHNYDEGDDIYFFGFSRGAYTARAIASMVAETGLLTKKGMDQFTVLYNKYYSSTSKGRSETPEAKRQAREYIKRLSRDQISPSAAKAIRIVGVWDTVAFHKPYLSSLPLQPLFKLLGFRFDGERIEFSDTLIPSRIEYGFHALSLDETRAAYAPTMWTLPKYSDQNRRPPILKQVWFSGVHTDVGGGRSDHRLSDISLAWMVSECSKTRLLAFDPEYLLTRRIKSNVDLADMPWGTEGGQTKGSSGIKNMITKKFEEMLGTAPRKIMAEENPTNETIHASIIDRRFGSNEGAARSRRYESNNLEGWTKRGWEVKKNNSSGRRRYLQEAEIGKVEFELKGKIRPATSEV